MCDPFTAVFPTCYPFHFRIYLIPSFLKCSSVKTNLIENYAKVIKKESVFCHDINYAAFALLFLLFW